MTTLKNIYYLFGVCVLLEIFINVLWSNSLPVSCVFKPHWVQSMLLPRKALSGRDNGWRVEPKATLPLSAGPRLLPHPGLEAPWMLQTSQLCLYSLPTSPAHSDRNRHRNQRDQQLMSSSRSKRMFMRLHSTPLSENKQFFDPNTYQHKVIASLCCQHEYSYLCLGPQRSEKRPTSKHNQSGCQHVAVEETEHLVIHCQGNEEWGHLRPVWRRKTPGDAD